MAGTRFLAAIIALPGQPGTKGNSCRPGCHGLPGSRNTGAIFFSRRKKTRFLGGETGRGTWEGPLFWAGPDEEQIASEPMGARDGSRPPLQNPGRSSWELIGEATTAGDPLRDLRGPPVYLRRRATVGGSGRYSCVQRQVPLPNLARAKPPSSPSRVVHSRTTPSPVAPTHTAPHPPPSRALSPFAANFVLAPTTLHHVGAPFLNASANPWAGDCRRCPCSFRWHQGQGRDLAVQLFGGLGWVHNCPRGRKHLGMPHFPLLLLSIVAPAVAPCSSFRFARPPWPRAARLAGEKCQDVAWALVISLMRDLSANNPVPDRLSVVHRRLRYCRSGPSHSPSYLPPVAGLRQTNSAQQVQAPGDSQGREGGKGTNEYLPVRGDHCSRPCT